MNRKPFDCVAMKRKAQSQLRAALAGKTPEAQATEIARRAARNPVWQELLQRNAQAPGSKRARTAR
jgi:hypothetical protein